MFKTLLVKITRSLTLKKIPHVVIGGQAVLIHGEPRLTRDIDVTYDLTHPGICAYIPGESCYENAG